MESANLVGSPVTLMNYEPATKDQPAGHVKYDGIVIGIERLKDEQVFPNLHIAFLDPKRAAVLNSVDWREAFDRRFSVPHEAEQENQPFYYRFDQQEQTEFISMLQTSNQNLMNTVAGLEMQVKAAQEKYARTTEGKDEALQAAADASAKPQAEVTSIDAKPNGKGKRTPHPAQVVSNDAH